MVHILGAFLYPLEDELNFLLGIGLVILRLYFLDRFCNLILSNDPGTERRRCVPIGNR